VTGRPRLTLQASPSGHVLAMRQDVSSARILAFASGVGAEHIGAIRLMAPIQVEGLVAGMAGQIADVVTGGGALYVAVEGFEPPATTTLAPATVILRVTAPSR
jgi:hypothetical protein